MTTFPSPILLENYCHFYAEVKKAKSLPKNGLADDDVVGLLVANIMNAACLIFSALAVGGILATPGGVGWKCGIAGVVYFGIGIPGLIIIFIYLCIRNVTNEKVLNKIEKTLDQAFVLNGSNSEKNQVPKEMWIHIFSFLSPKELLTGPALVSKQWNFLSKDKSLWKIHVAELLEKIQDHHLKEEIEKEPFLFVRRVYKAKEGKEKLSKMVEQVYSPLTDYGPLKVSLTKLFEDKPGE